MINIDKNDALYKYLLALGVDDIDNLYIELAKNGRIKRTDIQAYFRADFEPSLTNDIDESELEKVLDYYVDIRKLKKISSKELKTLLKKYVETQDKELREHIINSQLKDVLLACLNYKSLHKDIDLQDLVQTASIGLMDAVEKYEINSNIDLKDYIVYWVGRRIKDEFKERENG